MNQETEFKIWCSWLGIAPSAKNRLQYIYYIFDIKDIEVDSNG
jgi:hypothetical protein